MIRWCSLTCCITLNLIIFTNKYIIALTVCVLKTWCFGPPPGSPWTFWGKRIKFWKERSLSLLLNYKFPYYSMLFNAKMRELQMIKCPVIFLDFATSPFFRWCWGLKCLTEWGRRRLVLNLALRYLQNFIFLQQIKVLHIFGSLCINSNLLSGDQQSSPLKTEHFYQFYLVLKITKSEL